MPAGHVQLSQEPLIRAIHRHWVEMVFVGYVATIGYLSFVPFDYSRQPTHLSHTHMIAGLAMTRISMADILANICIYIPIGAVGFAVLRRRRLGRIVSACILVLLGGLMSFLIEHGQYWIQSRVASWLDVAANVLGTTLGILLSGLIYQGFGRMAAGYRAAARQNGWSIISTSAVCLVLLLHLRPYDVVVDLHHTAGMLRHANLSPLAAWRHLPASVKQSVRVGRRDGMYELPRVKWEYALDRFVDFVGYAGLTILLILGLSVSVTRRWRLYAWVGFVVVSLATMVTLIRIFLISHGLDTAHLVCGAFGWIAGCGIAQGLALGKRRPVDGPGHPQTIVQPDRGLPRRLTDVALMMGITLCLLYELVPFDFSPTLPAGARFAHEFCQVPFSSYFLSRPNDAFYDISGKLLRYGILGAMIAFLWGYDRPGQRATRLPWRWQLAASVLLTGTLCLILQMAHLKMISRHTDVTVVLLSIIASFVGSVAVRWAIDFHAYLRVVEVNDPLTAQLIEGPSFDKENDLVQKTHRIKANRKG